MPVIICISMVLLGFAIGYCSNKPTIAGILKIDRSDPDGPYLFLEFANDITVIQQQEYVTLKVDISNYISQD